MRLSNQVWQATGLLACVAGVRKGRGRAWDRALSPSRALARPKFPLPLPLPLLTPVTHATGARRSAEMNLASHKGLLNPRLVWSVCRSLGKTVHTFGKFLATPLIWYANFASSYHVIRHRSNKMIVPLYTVQRVQWGGRFDCRRNILSNFDGWRLNYRAFDGWRLLSENWIQTF